MSNNSNHSKIVRYVDKVPLNVEEKTDDKGYIFYLVSCEIGGELRVLARPLDWAISEFKKALVEDLKKDIKFQD